MKNDAERLNVQLYFIKRINGLNIYTNTVNGTYNNKNITSGASLVRYIILHNSGENQITFWFQTIAFINDNNISYYAF